MAIYNPTNPVSVGATAKKSQYDRAFGNTLALQEGSKEFEFVRVGEGGAPTPVTGEATIYADSVTHRALLSENGGTFFPLLTEGGFSLYDLGGDRWQFQEGNAYPAGAGFDTLVPGSGIWRIDPAKVQGTFALRVLLRVNVAAAQATVALFDLSGATPNTPLTGSEVSGTVGQLVGEVVQSGVITLPAGGSVKNFGVKGKTANAAHKVSAWQIQLVRT